MAKLPETTNSTDVTDAPTGVHESTADLGSIASGLIASMPDVQEHAVQMAHNQQQAQDAAPVDKNGTLFDPAQHVAGTDGKGRMTVRGTWELKRGRKATENQTGTASVPHRNKPSNSSMGGPAAPATPQQAADATKAAQDHQARAAGFAAAEMLFAAGRVIGGEEWAPMEDAKMGLDERAMMRQAFGDYFVAKGKTDIPPGAALMFCICAYAAPRFAMPKTQTRFQRVKGAVVTWWTNRKLRKMGLNVEVEQKRPEGTKAEK